MGTKYCIRTSESRKYPLGTVEYTDYYPKTIFEVLKIMFTKRKQLIYVTRWFN